MQRPKSILPRWLKLRDAALYSALGEKRLVALAEAGTLMGFQDPDSGRGDWVFDRCSLDAYREGQGAEGSGTRVESRVMEIVRGRRGK